MPEEQQTSVSQEGFPSIEDKGDEQLTLFSLQELAVKTTGTITDLRRQLKEAREMYKDSFMSDSVFHEEDRKLKEEKKKLQTLKAQMAARQEIKAMEAKIQDLQNEMDEKKDLVSVYALEVYRKTGQTEFEKDGETFEIKTVAKLVKRKQ